MLMKRKDKLQSVAWYIVNRVGQESLGRRALAYIPAYTTIWERVFCMKRVTLSVLVLAVVFAFSVCLSGCGIGDPECYVASNGTHYSGDGLEKLKSNRLAAKEAFENKQVEVVGKVGDVVSDGFGEYGHVNVYVDNVKMIYVYALFPDSKTASSVFKGDFVKIKGTANEVPDANQLMTIGSPGTPCSIEVVKSK